MKKLLSIAIAAIMLFALVACNNGDMQSKIDELEAQLQAQTDKIAELEQKTSSQDQTIDNLNQQKDILGELIDDLEEANSQQASDLSKLEAQLKKQENTVSGLKDKLTDVMMGEWQVSMMSIEDAYSRGLLTKDDLRHICYFYCGVVYEGVYNGNGGMSYTDEEMAQWTLVDFRQQIATPTQLSQEVITRIQQEAYRYVSSTTAEQFSPEDIRVYSYYGTYNGVIVADVADLDYAESADEKRLAKEIDGIIFTYTRRLSFPVCFSIW